MKLYTYYRSSAAYRVRIALELKGLAREDVYVHLLRREQRNEQYLELNPQGLLPTLIDDDLRLTQSIAILEYLEERYPSPALLPATPAARARVRQLALIVACDIHPLQNLRVQARLQELGHSQEQARAWAREFIEHGLLALEQLVAAHPLTGKLCHGDTPSLADVCLIPQLYNAKRFGCALDRVPTLLRIYDAAMELPAFERAAPEQQPDAE